MAALPCLSIPLLVTLSQFKTEIVPKGIFTVRLSVQVCPPKFKTKPAVPFEEGVPEIIKVKIPPPPAKVPLAKVAVKPNTPVEFIVWPIYEPPLPPV